MAAQVSSRYSKVAQAPANFVFIFYNRPILLDITWQTDCL
jgi:hypothetical protein